VDKHESPDEELRRFRAETTALLSIPAPPADGGKKPDKESP
jgi:hypothetical protein